jgi:CBS domain-containing protein
MDVETLMTRDVGYCAPDDAMATAARIMWERDCGIVPVVDPGTGRLVGVVTDRDLCMAAYTRDERLSRMRVREAMSARVFTCHPHEEVAAAHDRMRANQVRRLPVVDGEERLVGILSLNDLACHAASPAATRAEKREVAETLASICRHREKAAV